MWYDEAVVYQIYPLGALRRTAAKTTATRRRRASTAFCGCWTGWSTSSAWARPACCSNPLFESDAHGYDTRDYNKVDCRLGTNDDLRQVCAALHAAGMKKSCLTACSTM
mgnify:CR=1 FL=1